MACPSPTALDVEAHNWTFEENKKFELALAQYYHDDDRWTKIASRVPGKTVNDILRRYEQLENDMRLIHSEGHAEQLLHGCNSHATDIKRIKTGPANQPGMQPVAAASGPPEQRKGVPWTQDEHRLFLLGLAKFGKGSWRSIARQFVITRTPTQVASHAQKYFLRLNSIKDKKDKRRASIHDMTTEHIGNTDLFGIPVILPTFSKVSAH